MPQPFDPLRERLLRAGYAPRQVRRYCRELIDHLSDLTANELAAGRDILQAQAAARARLGSDEALAEAMLMRPSLRSWAAKAPWAFLVMIPIALLALAYIVPLAGLASWIGPHPAAMPPSSQTLIRSVCAFDAFTLPALMAGSIALAAARQRLSTVWPALGVLLIAYCGAGLRAHVTWPGHDPRDWSDWSIGIGFLSNPTAPVYQGRFRETGLLTLAFGAAVYWAVRLRSARA